MNTQLTLDQVMHWMNIPPNSFLSTHGNFAKIKLNGVIYFIDINANTYTIEEFLSRVCLQEDLEFYYFFTSRYDLFEVSQKAYIKELKDESTNRKKFLSQKLYQLPYKRIKFKNDEHIEDTLVETGSFRLYTAITENTSDCFAFGEHDLIEVKVPKKALFWPFEDYILSDTIILCNEDVDVSPRIIKKKY